MVGGCVPQAPVVGVNPTLWSRGRLGAADSWGLTQPGSQVAVLPWWRALEVGTVMKAPGARAQLLPGEIPSCLRITPQSVLAISVCRGTGALRPF